MRSCAAGAISRRQSDILSSKWFPQGLTGLRVRTRKGGGPLKVLIVILIVRLCVLCVPCGKTSRSPLSSSEPNRSNPNQSEPIRGEKRTVPKSNEGGSRFTFPPKAFGVHVRGSLSVGPGRRWQVLVTPGNRWTVRNLVSEIFPLGLAFSTPSRRPGRPHLPLRWLRFRVGAGGTSVRLLMIALRIVHVRILSRIFLLARAGI